MKSLLTASMLFAAMATSTAFAANDGGTWRGQGQSYDALGQSTGSFTLEIVETVVGSGIKNGNVTITPKVGPALQFTQQITVTKHGFSFQSEKLGHGGGYCFDNGVCQGLIHLPSGNSMAITIIKDGPDARRFLGTELRDGKAVRFISEAYQRVST